MVIYMIVGGLTTLWVLYDFFIGHKYFEGPRAAAKGFKNATLAPVYYLFGYTCDGCGRKFLSRTAITEHQKGCAGYQGMEIMRERRRVEGNTKKCPVCGGTGWCSGVQCPRCDGRGWPLF